MDELEKACDDVLIDTLPPGLKEAIDNALAHGQSKGSILRFVTKRAKDWSITRLQVEAYLERK